MFIEVTSDMVMPGPVIGEKTAETGVKAMLGEWMIKMRQKLLKAAQISCDSICIRTQSSVSYTAPVLSDSIEQTPQVSFIYVSNSVSSRELADQPVPDDHSIRHRYRRAGLPLVLRPKLV